MRDLRQFAADAILRDGGSIHVRAIRPDDKARLLAHFNRLSQRSQYFRFFGAKPTLTDQDLVQFTEMDFVHDVGLAATLVEHGEERIVGFAVSFREKGADARPRAEMAFAVEDAHQHRGIGTVLLEHLIRIARAHGVTEMEADALAENRKMLGVFRSSGFEMKERMQGGVFHIVMAAEETDKTREVIDRRERIAAAESLKPILEPSSIAVVGASRRKDSLGGSLLQNLRAQGFQGELYAVNPRTTEIDGLASFPSVAAIGKPVDLALVVVPASDVEAVVDDCAKAGVRGLVIISSGFAEVSPAGRDVQRRIRDRARAAGMRMVGPNCMGVLNTDPSVKLDATFAPVWPLAGNVGMLSQSGALGLAILDWTRKLNLGISNFVSVGNKADVSGNDLLSYWSQDPRTKVIALYLESFGNPRKFARLAPVVARNKPIVAVKSGTTAAGRRAAASHSAALANTDIAVDALFAQAGVIRTRRLEEMLDVVALLSSQPLPRHGRIAIVTNAGGPGILAADACEAEGMDVPALSTPTREALRAFLPPEASVTNPVDMIASASAEDYERALEIVGRDPEIDAIIAIYIPPVVGQPPKVAAGIARGAGKVPSEKAVVGVFISSAGAPPELCCGPRGTLPCYPFPENAARALSAALGYARWRSRPVGQPFELREEQEKAVRAVIDRALAEAQGPTWLSPRDLQTVLEAAEIPFAPFVETSAEQALSAAANLRFPVVVKAISKEIVHKSDHGLVITDLRNFDELHHAVRRIVEKVTALGAKLDGIMVQEHVKNGLEVLVGVTNDPTFGPIVLAGLGGVQVELLKDVSFRLTPVTDVDAKEMLDGLRTKKLFDGYRGAPKRDRAAFEQILLRVSALVDAVPELRELDLNPIQLLPEGQGAVAVDGRMRIGPLEDRI
ncbi:GNAT family N-acetyltransferase [Myxococcota bacterium]|nr:GNAT family N-acetyltransferase [Myxococcota bacterium]